MMNNLFSIFDPSASYLNTSWLLLLILMTLPSWKAISPIVTLLVKEINFTLPSLKKSEMAGALSLFLGILAMNLTALYPQVFSLTSHLIITLPLALVTWLTVNLFGWWNNTKHMLAHLVPQGTPAALMSFMVMIELTSNIIRPLTLCVRLTANLIAGHLLMTLLGSAAMALPFGFATFSLPIPLILTILETAVSFIQSYVFMTLIALYISETK